MGFVMIGFTGARNGMTDWQEQELNLLLANFKHDPEDVIFRHGDCVGSDEQAAQIFMDYGALVLGYPGHLLEYRANFPSHVTFEPENTIKRNKRIVDASQLLIATPDSYSPKPHSGTWSTISYSEGQEKPTLKIFPNGMTRGAYEFLLGER